MGYNAVLTKDSYQVTIGVIKIEWVSSKILQNLTPPTSSSNYASGPATTKIIDLLRIEKRINITGFIDDDESGNSIGTGDSSSTAKGKSDDIDNIDNSGGVFTMTIGSDVYTGVFEKIQIEAIIEDEGETNHKKYQVMFTFLRGENI